MKIRIGKYVLEVSVSHAPTLPEQVEEFAIQHYSSQGYLARNNGFPGKIARIKACRQLGKTGKHKLPHYLVDCKNWVEEHFEDNGKGAIKS